jgi:DNA (cytosine-5)-methyltransferase 1
MNFRVLAEAPYVKCKSAKMLKQLPPFAKLKTLDLFAGCGGLTSGLESSGLAECKWAVEWDKNAADSFSANFPNSTVFNEDVREWSRRMQVKT